MCRDTFLGRRRMQPLRTRVGVIQGYELCFDIPVGPGERGVGNIKADPSSGIWGVVYQLTEKDSRRLDRSEGVPQGVYSRIPVEVSCTDQSTLTAFTYESTIREAGRRASPRYMGLLLKGAQEHGLPGEYLHYLRVLPLAQDERQEAQLELFPQRRNAKLDSV